MKTQKEINKDFSKMKLNSFYDLSSIPFILIQYDENKALQTTEEGKKNLIVIQEKLKNIL